MLKKLEKMKNKLENLSNYHQIAVHLKQEKIPRHIQRIKRKFTRPVHSPDLIKLKSFENKINIKFN